MIHAIKINYQVQKPKTIIKIQVEITNIIQQKKEVN